MRRFFYSGRLEVDESILLPEEESHHIKTVMRLAAGTEIILFDGRGLAARVKIRSLTPQVTGKVMELYKEEDTPEKQLLVAQGLLQAKKMELVIQKSTELGVFSFTPLQTARSKAALTGQSEKKLNRWQRIVENSCKQSGRNHLMEVDFPVVFDRFLKQTSNGNLRELKLIFWEEEKGRLLDNLPSMEDVDRVIILLGPEGGFAQEEVELAQQYGYRSYSLGKRILRAETATISAVSILQYTLGNLG